MDRGDNQHFVTIQRYKIQDNQDSDDDVKIIFGFMGTLLNATHQNDGDSGYIGTRAAASSHPYGALPEDGCYRGRPKEVVVHVK